jgi:exopolysaccharide/PEP-CTERM locus tyrosine autokinase
VDSPSVITIPSELRLDFKVLSESGFLTPDTMSCPLAEEYRHLKRPLLTNAIGRGEVPIDGANLIAITSSLPGQGKTFTAFNLAMSIAMERDVAVLLVDADLIGSGLTRRVKLQGRPGLTDLLLEPQIRLHDVIVNTNVPNFRILPAGRHFRDVTELLASERMRDITTELSARYRDRVVLFDAPPLLATSQAMVVTTLTGQVLVVVEEGKTPQRAIQQAISLLDENKIIGMVLNNCLRSSKKRYYESYYHHSLQAQSAS